MERLSTMRAVRYVIGAGMFAIALGLFNARPAAAESCPASEGDVPPLLCGSVTDGSGGVGGADVAVNDSTGNPVASTTTSTCEDPGSVCGNYAIPASTFSLIKNDTYSICVGDVCKTVVITVDSYGDVSTIDDELTSSKRVDFVLQGGGSAGEDMTPRGPGTGTPGYWKNHLSAWPTSNEWPAGSIVIGGRTYTIEAAAKWLGTAVKGDKTITIFSSLVSAKLNVAAGNNPNCVKDAIANADNWMIVNYVGKGVKASAPEWLVAEPWHQAMDQYNNGLLECARHRD